MEAVRILLLELEKYNASKNNPAKAVFCTIFIAGFASNATYFNRLPFIILKDK